MRKIDILLIVFLAILIFVLLMLLFFYKSEGGECLKDPLGYSESKIGNNTYCSCEQIINFSTITYYSKNGKPLT